MTSRSLGSGSILQAIKVRGMLERDRDQRTRFISGNTEPSPSLLCLSGRHQCQELYMTSLKRRVVVRGAEVILLMGGDKDGNGHP